MKKRISSLLLIIMLLINCLPFQGVAAIGTPQYILDSETVQVGETFTMDVAIADNPGIISLRFKVSYDTEVLELKSVANSGILNGFTTPAPTITSPYTLRWADSLATTDNTAQGTVITLAFKALKVTNSSSVTIEHGEARNAMGTKVAFSNTTANVTVKEVPVNVIGVSLNKETLSLKTAESETLIATVSPNNATNKALSWKSEDNTIATVDNNGKVTAFKKGTTIVTVTTEDGSFTDTCEVSVACSHINQTPVTEKESDCKNQGWNAYAKCDDCGQLLSENGTTEIDEIPFRPLSEQHTGGTATCTAQAVCTVCGNSYGDLASHNYTAADKKAEALKTEGNCRDNAVYWYSCSACGLVENNDVHTFLGDKVATSHVGGTTLVGQIDANHKTQTDGYTGDTKCLGCNEIISYGQEIPAGAHIPTSNWTTDGTYHWKVCTIGNCGIVIDSTKAEHTSTGANVATCKTQATCDICDTAYGSLNANNHVGGTALVNQAEANHKTQTDGYTGDTKCLGCGDILNYGKPIPAGTHTPANVWSNDGEYHWKECTVVGCGIVIDGSKVAHSSTGDNVATCQTKAVCDVCNVSYGDFADHDWNTISWEKDASGHWHKCHTVGCTEENDFAGHTPDHQGGATEEYAIKCTICQFEIEAQLGHTHVFDKEVAEEQYLATKANCTDPAKYYKSCKCGEKGTETFTSGEKLGHTEGTAWEKDATHHWHTCSVTGCGVIIDNSKVAHTPDRAAATESDPIKCSVCGYEITPALGHTHAHGTEWKSDKDNHWNECACGDKANTVAHSDANKDGKCDVCEYEVGIVTPDPDNKPEDTNKPSDDVQSPQTGDNSMMWLWIALLVISGFGMVATIVMRKKFVR